MLEVAFEDISEVLLKCRVELVEDKMVRELNSGIIVGESCTVALQESTPAPKVKKKDAERLR